MSHPIGIKYVSLAEPSGYGVAARRCMLAVARAGIPLTWTPMLAGRGESLYYGPYDGPSVGDAELDPFCNRVIPYDVVIVHTVPEYFPYWVEAERGKTVVGHTVWETTAVPAHWPALLNAVDHLLVPCRWNATVFSQCGVTVPIDVVPHIADDLAASAAARAERAGGSDGDFVFYTIGVWTHRKALYATVKAFCEAFTADDPVSLLIKTNPHDLTAGRLRKYLGRSVAQAVRRVTRGYRNPPRIRLMTGVVGDSAIRDLHLGGDCYVSLCRGEGWGIGAFDAAAHGNPVVMTAFGGQLDYLDRELAYLVDYDLVPVINPQAPRSYSLDQSWAEPSVQHGAELLRHVATHPGEARARGRALQAGVLTQFGGGPVVGALVQALARANRSLPTRDPLGERPMLPTTAGRRGGRGAGRHT